MLSAIPKWITDALDSTPFKIFFALWTGVYIVQVLQGDEGEPTDELFWIVIGVALAFFFVPKTSAAITT